MNSLKKVLLSIRRFVKGHKILSLVLLSMIIFVLSFLASTIFILVLLSPGAGGDDMNTRMYPTRADTTVKAPTDSTTTTSGISKTILRKGATLGYHYNPVMTYHTTQEINVYLSVDTLKRAIRDTLTKILKEEDPDRDPKDTGKIEFEERIPIYKYVSMQLVPLDSGIVVRKSPDAERQQIDTLIGNKWSWTIYANSAEKEESKLLLVVNTQEPSTIKKRYIHIAIHVESNLFRLFYNYLTQHPGDALFKIIVPLITFLGGLLFAQRSKKKKDSIKGGKSDATDSDTDEN